MKLTSSQLARLNQFLRSKEFDLFTVDTKAWVNQVKRSKNGRYEVFWKGIKTGCIRPISQHEKEVALEAVEETKVIEADKAVSENDDTPVQKVLYSFYIDPNHLAALKAVAAAEDRPVSGLIRLAVTVYLRHLEAL